MPTLFSFDGLRVVVYPNDHRPAHVHVIGPDREVVFNLRCPDGPPVLRDNYDFRSADLSRIEAELASALARLCEKWRIVHGHY
jgi:Domain of unknown function (DUF4160)